jgi:glycosyltransferase involved in cell wall biosynthesis
MHPSVSVGIPTYNRSAWVRQAIQSVRCQTFRDFEIIVCDDNSSDDTADVVHGLADPRIRYQPSHTNLRPPRSWNACVRQARGEFFALLPDDDVYCPGFLTAMTEALRAQPGVGFAQCDFYKVDDQLRPFQTVQASPTPITLRGEAALTWQLERLGCLPVTLLFRRAAMIQMGLWREGYWDDWAFIVRLAYRHGFTTVPRALAGNRVHSQNLSQALRRESRDTILDLINQQSDVFGEALPATPALLALRARLNRQLSHHCMLLTFGALRRIDWARARFHFRRARQLYALAGLDPGFVGLWLTIRAELAAERRLRAAGRSAEPIIRPDTAP